MRPRLYVALLAVPLVILTACSSGSGASSGGASGGGGGGNLNIVTAVEPSDLAPNTLKLGGEFEILGHDIFQGLVGRNPKTYALMPELALSWKQTSPTVWQFNLRHGVTFQDGSPFDAQAAVTALTYWYKASVPSVGDFVGSPAKFKAAGKYTLDMTTETPDPIVPYRMTMVPISSAKQITADPQSIPSHAIGTGPYEIVSWTHGQNIQLKLYAKSYLASPRMFDTIDWMFRSDPDVRADMIKTGEADVTDDLTPDQCSGEVTCKAVPNVNVNFLRIDDYNQVMLGNGDVRKAVFMAINRSAINKAFYDNAPVLNNPVPEGGIGYNPNAQTYNYDPSAAKAFLAKARAAGVNISRPISVYANEAEPGEADVAQVVTSDLKAIGLNASTKVVSNTESGEIYYTNFGGKTLQKNMPNDRDQIWVAAFGNEVEDGAEISDLLLTCTGKESVYCNPKTDAAYEAANQLGGTARNQAFQNLWTQAYADLALLPLAQGTELWAFGSKAQGASPRPDGALPLWVMKASS
jgi:peptide/nickel transport system substrate-binding protein